MSVRVLIIEDDEDDYVIIKHYLTSIKTEKYDVYWCNDFDLAEEEILKEEHDIYLIDQFLGKGEGIEIIERARAKNILKPLILLTGSSNYSVDEKAMSKGASDFLIKKEVRVDTLERAMRYALERYNQQQFIRTQERKYRSLFELSMEPFIILDKEMAIIEYNAAFSGIFHKYNLSEIAIKDIAFKTFFKYSYDFELFKKKLAEDGFIKGFKTTFMNQGKDIVVILSIARLPHQHHANGGAYHVAISDLTKIMEQEAELKKAEKMSMSGRMARMIAHEIRNPLTNIQLAVGELTAFTSTDEFQNDARFFTDIIKRNTSRISGLIDELLKSARPPELELVKSDLQTILTAAIDFCQDRIELLNIDLYKDFGKELIVGHWDPEKLKIAFANIIINAIEAMEEEEYPVLSIAVEQIENATLVVIRDNGKGMDEETLRNLFDPFYTNRKEGMGLGMTATLNIINMHKGKVHVNSKEGEGTEFIITL